MTNYAALKDRLYLLFSKYAGKDDAAFSLEDKQEIERIYEETFGRPIRVCTCKNRVADALIELFQKVKSMASRYTLKRGALICIGTDYYSSVNLTDEVAEKYLAMHPEDVVKFERVPAPKAPAKPKAKKSTKKEA